MPICLVKPRGSFHLTPCQVAAMLDRLVESEGQIDVLNLSGGEPTLNPQFREIIDECLARTQILYVSVSTNAGNCRGSLASAIPGRASRHHLAAIRW